MFAKLIHTEEESGQSTTLNTVSVLFHFSEMFLPTNILCEQWIRYVTIELFYTGNPEIYNKLSISAAVFQA